ncbi:MAG: hypothetical protein WBO04_09245 [Steroidobacteraceae bacterium]
MQNAAIKLDTREAYDVAETARYARIIKASKRVRWDIDADVIRGRAMDFSQKFLPDGLAKMDGFPFLAADERRLMSQVQGRTYAYVFGLVERFIGAKVLELSGQHWLGDQVALEALVRFSDEELKRQELFRRIEADAALSPPWKDVFKYHWMEEVQHAMLDEIEREREHGKLQPFERDRAVDDLIGLVGAVDGILQAQAAADADYFIDICKRGFTTGEQESIRKGLLRAYRWQYIVSGVQHPHFARLLTGMTTEAQMSRIQAALAPVFQG